MNEGAVGTARLKREAGIIRDLNGYIGSMKLKNINAEVVENLYAQMRADKLEQNGKVSSTTRNISVGSVMGKYCAMSGILAVFVCKLTHFFRI